MVDYEKESSELAARKLQVIGEMSEFGETPELKKKFDQVSEELDKVMKERNLYSKSVWYDELLQKVNAYGRI